jgi:predicted O-methyltransferase YrrM
MTQRATAAAEWREEHRQTIAGASGGPSSSDYGRIFAVERSRVYKSVDLLEDRIGYSLERARLEAAARVLACPFKAAPPNWQHGRVLYALVRQYLGGLVLSEAEFESGINLLDIGTAKGFSALCLRWAADDAGFPNGRVFSTDVIQPSGRVPRNTVAEVGGYRTLPEILQPWPEAARIEFSGTAGIEWLVRRPVLRIHAAFVDGKHDETVVRAEAVLLSKCQRRGDLVLFDDVQIRGVGAAVLGLSSLYDVKWFELGNGTDRTYAIGVRK